MQSVYYRLMTFPHKRKGRDESNYHRSSFFHYTKLAILLLFSAVMVTQIRFMFAFLQHHDKQ